MTTRLWWFPAKQVAWNEGNYKQRAIKNNCPLFVWQNQGNFIQSVIKTKTASFNIFLNAGRICIASAIKNLLLNDQFNLPLTE